MSASLRLTLALALIGGLLAGCGRQAVDPVAPNLGAGGSTPAANDQAEVSAILARMPELIEDGQFESAAQTSIDGGVPGSTAAIQPLFFFRNITNVERRFEFAFADTDSTGRPTTAVVTVHKFLTGSFNIATGTRTEEAPLDSARLRIVRKPLADHWVRRILLKRMRVPDAPALTDHEHRDRMGWRMVASSGVKATSRAASTRILSLQLQSAHRDTTITDPLAFYRLRRIVRFEPMEEVRLIVTTGRADDVVVLLHGGLRTKFRNNGDNTYTFVWRVPAFGGLHHVGVNALSRGTLFDDVEPYDSQAWIVPYTVSPWMLAEFMP